MTSDSATPGELGRMLARRNLTRLDLAAQAHIDRKTITKIDQGRRVKRETLEAVARALKVPLTHLTAPTDDKARSPDAQLQPPAGNLLLKKLIAADVPELLRLTDLLIWQIELPAISPKAQAALEKLDDVIESFRAWENDMSGGLGDFSLRSQLRRFEKVRELEGVLEELHAERIAIFAAKYLRWRRHKGDFTCVFTDAFYAGAEQYTSSQTAVLYVDHSGVDSKRVSVNKGPEPPRYSHEEFAVVVNGERYFTKAEAEAKGMKDGEPVF